MEEKIITIEKKLSFLMNVVNLLEKKGLIPPAFINMARNRARIDELKSMGKTHDDEELSNLMKKEIELERKLS